MPSDLTEEDPQITEARRQQIEDVAIDAAWLFETAKKEHWVSGAGGALHAISRGQL